MNARPLQFNSDTRTLLQMIQAIHCVAVFSLDVEHKEEDRREAVKTEVRFLLSLLFLPSSLARVSVTLARTLASYLGVIPFLVAKPLLARSKGAFFH